MSDRPPSKLLSYLRLFRLPNVFTAIADVAMGYLFVHQTLEPLATFACLVGATACLYTAGMILNDVYDIGVDLKERPDRPLPAGRIALPWARWLGYQLLLMGVALGWLAGYIYPSEVTSAWRSGVVASMLAASILLYDVVLKQTPLGPLAMGSCRLSNILMGMSVVVLLDEGSVRFLTYDVSEWLIAGGIGLYIVGVTWFARDEAAESRAGHLIGGVCLMGAGILALAMYGGFGLGPDRMLGFVQEQSDFGINLKDDQILWPVLLLLITVTIVRRCMSAVLNPSTARVQIAVKQCILSLIVLDASICLFAAGPTYAIGVLALLVPTIVLGKWVYST